MNVTISPLLEAMVLQKIESGKFASANDVVDQALRLLEEVERYQELDRAIAVGLDQYERGEVFEGTVEFFAKIREEANENVNQGKPIKSDVRP